MKQNIIGKCLLSITCLALLACGGSDSSTANNSDIPPEIRIINGTEHGAADLPQFVKVLSQNSEGQVGGCTGTAISPKVIITATHCIIEAVAVLVQIGDSLENDPVFVPEKIIYDQNYGVLPEDGRLVNDLALIFLKEPHGLPVLPLLGSTQPVAGDYLMVVGFGLPSMDGEYGVRRAGTMRAESVDQYHIISKFDKKMSNVCFGDSGGPIIMLLKDAQGNSVASALAGITSWGTSQDCSEGENVYFTNIGSFISGILQLVPDASIA